MQAISHTLACEGRDAALWSQLPSHLLQPPAPLPGSLVETQAAEQGTWAHALRQRQAQQLTQRARSDLAGTEPVPSRLAASCFLQICGLYCEPHLALPENLYPAAVEIEAVSRLSGMDAQHGPEVGA